ncbi:TRAP transporter solute receptor, TAXI family [Thermovirga lienii DSM 17291]|uniref:TRAP transporter solute receptor, TAXI family n=1 Tax=Thermovirga lienii (strain ATCC BAA-1197 / DSM 17291 / Cas60314) TaxID=580340 RepID=G7V811_THELD|nr:TAXI family TRAP transporter solute-binding subunit [Thermovirga lienii]AER66247.1 TRAP transporter solute receptor, TAXI family [Thermovirga lienii DSM 17291]
MKKKALMTVMALLLVGCFAFSAGAVEFVTIVTGSTGGTYYPVGTILANHFNQKLLKSGYKFSAQSSGGTTENLDMLKKSEAQMAIAMCNLTGFAYTGTNRYEGKPNPNLRYVIGLWPEVSQFVYAKSSGIKGWSDLKGKKIAVGPAASGTEFSTRTILKAVAGLTFDDITPEYLGYSEASQALQNGRIDAALLEAGYPTSAVTELYAGKTEVDMLIFDDEAKKKLFEAAPWYAPVTVPAGTYPKQDKDLPLVGVKCALLAHPDVKEEVVYNALKVIYEDREDLLKEHAVFYKVDFENPLAGLYGAPLHPGAVKFFKEKGLNIPEELLPPEMK